MKKFLAVYLGNAASREKSGWDSFPEAKRREREQAGIAAWGKWLETNRAAIVDTGSPIGKTKRTDAKGVADTKNDITAFAVVQAESHEAAAKLFENHPHFSIFPGDSVEIMECLPIPGR